MTAEQKPILCLDFDGVLHAYTSGWQGVDKVTDGPVPGAMDFLARAVDVFDVCILSSRSKEAAGMTAMQTAIRFWLVEAGHDYRVYDAIGWPTEKPAAFLTIDDRALTFDGTFPTTSDLLTFLPWNKRPPSPEPEPIPLTPFQEMHQKLHQRAAERERARFLPPWEEGEASRA